VSCLCASAQTPSHYPGKSCLQATPCQGLNWLSVQFMYHVLPGLCDAVLCSACRALLKLSGLLRLTWRSKVHRVTKVCWVQSVIQNWTKLQAINATGQKAHKARALLNWRWRLQPQFLLTNYSKNPSPQLMWKPRCRCCDFWRASGSRVPMGGVNLDSDSTAKDGKRHLGFGPPVSDFDLKVMLVHLFGSLCSSFENSICSKIEH